MTWNELVSFTISGFITIFIIIVALILVLSLINTSIAKVQSLAEARLMRQYQRKEKR